MESTIEIGEEVRASLGNGLMLRGEVQELRSAEARVKGRWIPLSAVKSVNEIEDVQRSNRIAVKQLALQIAKQQEEAEKAEKKIPVMLPTGGSYDSFVVLLNNTGYYFDVRVREDGFETAVDQYLQWSGEELPEEAVYVHTNCDAWTAVEWRILATVPEGEVFPFETAVAGTLGRGHSVGSALLDNGCRLTINCESIVEQLVRSGLRVRKERSWRHE